MAHYVSHINQLASDNKSIPLKQVATHSCTDALLRPKQYYQSNTHDSGLEQRNVNSLLISGGNETGLNAEADMSMGQCAEV